MSKQRRPTQKYLDFPKLKVSADDTFNIGTKETPFSDHIENIVGNVEIAHYEHFILLPQCFHKFLISVSMKHRTE